MKKLFYSITTLEPLIITQNSDDPTMYETLQYIRGTVIQGIFAQYYIKANQTADNEFTRLIVSGDCVFSNAYPSIGDQIYFPAPFSIVRKKYPPKAGADNGLKKEKALDLLVVKTDDQTKGISQLITINSGEVSPITIPKEIRLHNEIDDQKRTTKERILFNYQSLPAGMIFKGFISIKDEKDESRMKSLFPQNTEIRMGRSATSEYGKVKFNWIDQEQENAKPEGEVILTLLSDTIIYNDKGFSSLLQNDFENYLEDSKILESLSRKARIEGFLNIWKLRKPSENVFAAGSSFLLDKLPANADYVLNYGLGERTQEGYGQVSFSIQKPAVFEYDYVEFKKQTISKPLVMPGLTKEILTEAFYNRKKEEVIGHALRDADATHPKIESNHLLGKLKAMAFSPGVFKGFLDNLRQTAKSHLTKSYVGNKNLEEHFRGIISGEIKIYTSDPNVDISRFDNELKGIYFEQFLNQLRRKNKTHE